MRQSVLNVIRSIGLLVLMGWAATGAALSQSVVATGQSFITPRLLPGAVQPDGGRMAGLRLSLEPGWKTYWRTPGETGIPPRFDWSGSKNIREVHVLWPRPALFESFGMQTAGYADVVLFPLELTPVDPAQPMFVHLSADLGVCKEICVLERVEIAMDISVDAAEIGVRQIRSAMRQVPMLAEPKDVRFEVCRIQRNGSDHRLSASLALGDAVTKPTVLVESSQGLWIKRTKQRATDSGVAVDVDFALPKDLSWLDRSAFRMTVLSDHLAYELHGCSAG